jgi:hypothetical protein
MREVSMMPDLILALMALLTLLSKKAGPADPKA